MQFDYTYRVTDIIMIIAVFAGPVVAVQITEYLRRREDSHKRKVHIFRTLMSTRNATLAVIHIEALNLVEVDFDAAKPKERGVLDCWRLYISHLNDHDYPKETWLAH